MLPSPEAWEVSASTETVAANWLVQRAICALPDDGKLHANFGVGDLDLLFCDDIVVSCGSGVAERCCDGTGCD